MAKKKRAAKKPMGAPTSADPVRLAKWLANPGLRSKLDDSLLSPEQRKQRTIARDPYHKAIESLTTQKFGGAITEVQGAQKKQDTHTANVGDWFGQYQAELAKSRDRQQAMQQAATQSVADRTSSFASMNNQGNQQDQAAMQADAASRGATVGPQVQKVAGDANTIREALGKQSANTLATQGVSNNAAAEGALSAAFGEAALAKQGEQTKRSSLDAQLRDILRERDAFKITARGDLVDAEQKARLEAQAFGLDSITKINPKTGLPYDIDPKTGRPFPKPKGPMSEADKAAKARNDFFLKHGYYPPTGPPKDPKAAKKKRPTRGPGSLTVGQENKIHGDISRAQALAKKAMGSKDPATGKPYTTAQIRQALEAGEGTPGNKAFSKDIVNIAMDLVLRKGLSGPNVRAAHRLGVHVGGRYKVLKGGSKPTKKTQKQLDTATDIGKTVENIGKLLGGE